MAEETGGLTHQDEKDYLEGRALLNGPAEDRERGKVTLSAVVDKADGTDLGRKARELLESVSQPLRPSRLDPLSEEFLHRWVNITSLTHPALAELLGELKENHAIRVRLRETIFADLSRWVNEKLPYIKDLRRAELQAVRNFIQVSEGSDFNDLPELAALRKAIFNIHYNHYAPRILDALNDWNLAEALGLIEEVGVAPGGFEEEMRRLQEQVDQVTQRKKAMMAALDGLPASEPTDWLSAKLLIQSLVPLQNILAADKLPPSWRGKAQEAFDLRVGLAEAFMKGRAARAVEILDLQDFWLKASDLNAQQVDARLTPVAHWFSSCLDHSILSLSREVRAAESPDALTERAAAVGAQIQSLPIALTGRLSALVQAMHETAEAWQLLRQGHQIEIPTNSNENLPRPTQLLQDVEIFRAVMERVEGAFSAIANPEAEPAGRNALLEAEKVAKGVLAQWPEHARGIELLHKAQHNLSVYALDEALREWRISDFFALLGTARNEEFYAQLANCRSELETLSGLAGRPDAQDWQTAAEWWQQWCAVSGALEKQSLPAVLTGLLAAEKARRLNRWLEILEAFKTRKASADVWQAAADSLDAAAELSSYQREFARRAAVERARRFIETGEFAEAETIVSSLDADHKDTRRLRMLVEIERARQRSIGDLARVLYDKWNAVRQYVERPFDVLLAAVEDAWVRADDDVLRLLRVVIDRALVHPQPDENRFAALQGWDLWLQLEDELSAPISTLAIKRLTDYLRAKEAQWSDTGLHERLRRLVEVWSRKEDYRTLTWAYQAFAKVSPEIMKGAEDPVIRLSARSDSLITNTLDTLRVSCEVVPAHLEQALREMEAEQAEWQQLDEFYIVWPGLGESPKPSPQFTSALNKVRVLADLATDLIHLHEVDLRNLENRNRLQEVMRRVKAHFDGFAFKDGLLAQVNRLYPLAYIGAQQEVIYQAADRCGGSQEDEFFELNLFRELAKEIREQAGVFEKNGAKGGAMWRIISEESCREVFARAGILRPLPNPPDLDRLAEIVDLLQDEDASLQDWLNSLLEEAPPLPEGGRLVKENHQDYLLRFPKNSPQSLKVYRQFERKVYPAKVKMVLQQCRNDLPEWVGRFLDEGIPKKGTLHV